MKNRTEIKKQNPADENKKERGTARSGHLHAANHWYFRMPHVKGV